MSKFQKIEKMDNISDSVLIDSVELSTPSSISILEMTTNMCTIKATDPCPAGFVSSRLCISQNESDVNTNTCVIDTNYSTPSMNSPSMNK